MTYDIIVLNETSVFVSPHENSKPAFFCFIFLNSTWDRLRKPAFSVALFQCAKTAKREKKSPFSKTCR